MWRARVCVQVQSSQPHLDTKFEAFGSGFERENHGERISMGGTNLEIETGRERRMGGRAAGTSIDLNCESNCCS